MSSPQRSVACAMPLEIAAVSVSRKSFGEGVDERVESLPFVFELLLEDARDARKMSVRSSWSRRGYRAAADRAR